MRNNGVIEEKEKVYRGEMKGLYKRNTWFIKGK
jgi:hypothetical protein